MLQLIVKNILEKNGLVSKHFKNYNSGEGWMRNYLTAISAILCDKEVISPMNKAQNSYEMLDEG